MHRLQQRLMAIAQRQRAALASQGKSAGATDSALLQAFAAGDAELEAFAARHYANLDRLCAETEPPLSPG